MGLFLVLVWLFGRDVAWALCSSSSMPSRHQQHFWSASSQFCIVLPSRIEFHHVSQRFPLTLQRRLFSSVPYREWALRDVNFVLESEMLLLTGASSSGKSTILRTILQHGDGDRQPTSGSVHIRSVGDDNGIVARPIYLDQKPPLERCRSVSRVLMDTAGGQIFKPPDKLLQHLINDLLDCVDLDCRSDQTPTDLSPSEQYRLELARACLTGMLSNQREERQSEPDSFVLPAPILLLDEWLDKETSVVVQSVQTSIERLVQQLGAVVLVVTHKPERWNKSSEACSHMTLSGGKILSLQGNAALKNLND